MISLNHWVVSSQPAHRSCLAFVLQAKYKVRNYCVFKHNIRRNVFYRGIKIYYAEITTTVCMKLDWQDPYSKYLTDRTTY